MLQIVLLVKIILVCRVCLTEQLKGGKRNTAKTIDSVKATELIATACLRTRESTVNTILKQDLSFLELPMHVVGRVTRADALFVVANNVGRGFEESP